MNEELMNEEFMNADLNKIVGKVIKKVEGLEKESESVSITFTDDWCVNFHHEQNCCESVCLIDFENDNVEGGVIINAEEIMEEEEDYHSSQTWTFYKIETTKGEIWMRWLGVSNGYYSEAVHIDLYRLVKTNY